MRNQERENPGNWLYSQCDANRARLEKLFPKQFDSEHIGRDWPDGWHPIVLQICEAVERLGLGVTWVQIKEKFAGLRMYYDGAPVRMDLQGTDGVVSLSVGDRSLKDDALRPLLALAEEASLETCMKCGEEGSCHNVGGWYLTLCAAHLEQFKKLRERWDRS